MKTEPEVPEDSYCRLCLNEDNLSRMRKAIRKIIAKEYPIQIQIKDEDGLSKEICGKCRAFLSEIIEFRKRMEEFGEMILKKQNLLGKILKKDITIRTTNTIKDALAIDLTDDLATNVTASNDIISKIVKTIELDDVEKTQQMGSSYAANFCDICKVKSSDSAKFLKHSESVIHKFKENAVNKSGNRDLFLKYAVAYKCTTCMNIFTFKTSLAQHSQTQHGNQINRKKIEPNLLLSKGRGHQTSTFTCINCYEAFPTVIELVNHGPLCTLKKAQKEKKMIKLEENKSPISTQEQPIADITQHDMKIPSVPKSNSFVVPRQETKKNDTVVGRSDQNRNNDSSENRSSQPKLKNRSKRANDYNADQSKRKRLNTSAPTVHIGRRLPICRICRKRNSHFFCNPCSRCFLGNEVQYSNHMKMKHSS